MSNLNEFYGPNAGYVLELYERYRSDPDSIPPSTRRFFESWRPEADAEAMTGNGGSPAGSGTLPSSLRLPSADLGEVLRGAAALAQAIREYGHQAARIDPLGTDPPGDPELDLATHGIREEDLAALPPEVVGIGIRDAANALEAIGRLRAIYCGTTGYDYDHIQAAEERAWLRDAAESGRFHTRLSATAKRQILERLTQVEAFERFLHRTFPGQKRFSIEGADMLVLILDEAIRCQTYRGNREVVMGMAHRGRLNVLAHVLNKPYAAILAEFQRADKRPSTAASDSGDLGWTGDVRYHLGGRRSGAVLQVSLTLPPNPSHLEFIDPVVEGMARATQDRRDTPGPPQQDREAALALLIHGDASFPGEGIVAETLNLSRLPGYQTGGTIHIIVNNQIGFTTPPPEGRSTLYAGDLAKGFEIPIVHVNADDPEACLAAARLACAYRDKFHKDFLIDLVGYRRWGHNEVDEPAFTQPQMYERIRNQPTARDLWARELVRQGIVTEQEVEESCRVAYERLDEARRQADEGLPLPEAEDETQRPAVSGDVSSGATGVEIERLRALNEALLRWPEGFHLNPRLERPLQRRRDAFEAGGTIDWGHAETLAFASILADGTPIRITGQDTERGTFSQRHLVLHDAVTGTQFTPLHALPAAGASFAVYNSPLSENAPLGFEYGYSVQAPTALVLWEAQFGDFINAGQVIVDQFIASARAKWRQTPGLVLLLPHGYEGQGPEHSSARLERWLQLAAGDNLRIVNCTTAAQYFHVLRRQAALLTRDSRPLVVMSPKSLLRHPRAASVPAELAQGEFQRVLDNSPLGVEREPVPTPTRSLSASSRSRKAGPDTRHPTPDTRSQVSRLLLCSGKIAVDLLEAGGSPDTALARVEELYPFPDTDLARVLQSYPNLREIVWVQEEPENMGAWSYIALCLRDLADSRIPLRYIGRPARASTAEGSAQQHAAEQARIIAEALGSGVQASGRGKLTAETQRPQSSRRGKGIETADRRR